MELKRDRESEPTRNDRLDPGVAFAAVHTKSNEQHHTKQEDERISLFWRVFGGTLLSIAALVAITLFNNFSSTISELRGEINRINEARGELIKKDEFNTRIAANYERVQSLQTQNNTQNATITSLQTAMTELKDRITAAKSETDLARKDAAAAAEAAKKEITAALEAIRKDQASINDGLKKDLVAVEGLKERFTAVEAVKKDLSGLETVKDRMTMMLAEMKDHRDDLAKLRQDTDRNQAADAERKKSRDEQYTKLLETMKDLDRAVRICSEKVARLEGSVSPTEPKKPKTTAGDKSGTDE